MDKQSLCIFICKEEEEVITKQSSLRAKRALSLPSSPHSLRAKNVDVREGDFFKVTQRNWNRMSASESMQPLPLLMPLLLGAKTRFVPIQHLECQDSVKYQTTCCGQQMPKNLNGLVHWTAQRDGMGREEGGGFGMGNTCIPVVDSF